MLDSNGYLKARRAHQALEWMRELIGMGLEERFRNDSRVAERLPKLRAAVERGVATPLAASNELLALFSEGREID